MCARERDGFAAVLVEGGTSSGDGGGGANAAVALAAAAAGADSVVFSEPLPSTAAAARALVAASGFAQVVKVVEGGNGSGNGGEKINILALDAFDASLLGSGAEALARSVARRRRSPFLAPKGLAAVVPARGTLWCAGVEAKCRGIGGGGGGGGSGGGGSGGGSNFDGGGDGGGGKTSSPSSPSSSPAPLLPDLSALDRYRWRPSATTVIDLETAEPCLRFLTGKARAWQGSFGFSEEEEDDDDDDEEEEEEEEEVEVEVEKKKKKRSKKKKKKKEKRHAAGSLPLTLDARAKGELTAVAFWFELDFGGGVRLSTEPSRWKEVGEGKEKENGGRRRETTRRRRRRRRRRRWKR